MISEIDVYKIIITAINVVILLWLPCMVVWHILQMKKAKNLSYEWVVQLLFVFCFCLAVNCEIPALWSRYIAYYKMHMTLPEGLYFLTSWDRWGHVLEYAFFSLTTIIVTRKHVPKIIMDTLS